MLIKFATSWMFPKIHTYDWKVGGFGQFKKHESICIRVKHNTELFLRILRIRDPKMEGMVTNLLGGTTLSMRRFVRELCLIGSRTMLKCLKFRLLPFLYGLFDI